MISRGSEERREQEQTYQAGLRLLSYRARSRRELAQRLARRFSPSAIQEALAQLEAHGYLDDAAFAQAWRRTREAHRPRSASLVRRELIHHGVPRETAEATVDGMDDEANAYQAAHRRVKALAGLEEATFRRRLTDYLRRRGFPYAVASMTVDRVWRETRGEI
ncbi:MAG: regulatory protein RecX [Chloroflexi bacterium]|nr:regulatory protein RecX [Chloroflexota bacterium]